MEKQKWKMPKSTLNKVIAKKWARNSKFWEKLRNQQLEDIKNKKKAKRKANKARQKAKEEK